MKTMKKLYVPPRTESIGLLQDLPSLLATVSTIPTEIDGDWIEFGDIEDKGEWG